MTDETLFAEALEKATSAERAEYLNAACQSAEQRARVESLLAAHDQAGSFLGRPAVEDGGSGDTTRATPANDGGTHTFDPDEHRGDDDLSFLAPSDRPGALGRIGQYDVLEVLGRGGFGIVFRAFDDKLQRVVAVKVLAPHMAATSPARKRFLREARSAAAVRHENVVQIHAVEEQPLPHLVMEYIPGATLQDRLDRTGPLDTTEALRIGRQVADGLAAAHAQGLIHRDIKPSNILIDAGPNATAKITDFGLARAADDASLTRSGAVAGTPMYMAPEQARGETLDHRADLFSLGSVLYVMLSGRPPFRANSTLAVLKRVADDTPRPIREIIPEVPAWLCRIVEKLHAKDPAERFQTAREVADLLADCEKQLTERKELTDLSRIPAGKPTLASRAKPKRKGMPGWVWVLIALAGLFVVGCVGVPVLAVLYWALAPVVRPINPPDDPPEVMHEDSPRPGMTMRVDDGFTPLFDGQTLTGWKEFPAGRGSWTVEDGVLVGKGKPNHLFTERADFANFHLRMEVRVRSGTKAGALGVFGRVPMEDPGMVISPHGEGSLYRQPVAKLYDDTVPPLKPPPPSYREHPIILWGGDLKAESTSPAVITADEWLTYELIVDDGHVSIITPDKNRGSKSMVYSGVKAPRGRLALQLFDAWSVVEIRKIEIKELPLAGGPADVERLKGEWVVTSATLNGKSVADDTTEEMSFRFGDGTFEMATGHRKEVGTFQLDPVRQEVLLKFARETVPVRTTYRLVDDRLRLTLPGPAGVPGVIRDRFATASINNLMQLGMAAIQYADTYGALPPPAVAPKGTPLLSWRVLLLPYIEQGELYKQFRLDEPWDSEHNKKLVAKMPKVFATPGAKAPEGQTHYRAFTGPGTAFDAGNGGKGVKLAEILDGTANTLLFVEAAEPVVWTKPDDLSFDPKGPLPKLGVSADGANVVFCDIHTATLAVPVKDDTLRGLVTRNGGEKVAVPVLMPAKSDENKLVLECIRSAFRPLFDGKTLTGWKTHKDQPGEWAVEEGAIVGRGSSVSHLFSEREYGDFHLRAQVKVNSSGDSGVWFRAPFDLPKVSKITGLRYPAGFEAQIYCKPGGDEDGKFTGSLGKEAPVRTAPHPADGWFDLEVIARGDTVTTWVNGKKGAELKLTADDPRRGHLALQASGSNRATTVRFRKVEIKEWPVDKPSPEVAERRKEVAAREKARDEAKVWVNSGKVNKLHLLAAEVELTEARVKLAEAEGDAKAVVDHLEALVKYRQEERDFIAEQVKAEAVRPEGLDAADARLADAKARLTKARPPK